jgi:hypothetical protein
MEETPKKLDLYSVIAIVLLAISITLFDFEDWSWNTNSKSYLGFILGVVLVVYRYTLKKRQQ